MPRAYLDACVAIFCVERHPDMFPRVEAALFTAADGDPRHAQRQARPRRIVGSTTGMYGALQGIIGQSLAAMPALELDDARLLKSTD